uniref:CCHC-type domain-containing protein n=1 Tax=viral metagenome TaxID=1070528 RepID=A0A6C0C425_9ZZZZ
MNLYILKLKEGKYYVGTTSKNVIERLEEHMSGRGSNWTKKYKVLKLEKTIENCDKYDEDKWTKIYMDRHGIKNVRGGSYCEINLHSNSIKSIEREVTHANDRCLYCHKVGHFIKNCPDKMDTSSKMYYKNLNYLNMSCDFESESESEFIDSDGEVWEESPCEFVGARDGTIFDSQMGYIRPKKKNNSGKCYKCGRFGHYASNCYARKHVRGYNI